jgi:hypothetical protein
MTNCVRCGTEIPVRDIIAGNYKKVDGNPFCVKCAASSEAPAAAAPAKAAAPTQSASTATMKKASVAKSASGSSSTGIRPGSSASLKAKPAPRNRDEIEEVTEERPRFRKTEDPTTKIVTIIAIVLLVVGGGLSAYFITKKRNTDRAADEAWANSVNAVTRIREDLRTKTDDSQIDEIDSLITQLAPQVLDAHSGDLITFRAEIKQRRENAVNRKKFNEIFEYLKTNAKIPEKCEEVAKQMIEADKLVAFATDAQKKDLAIFKVLNQSSILENHYNKALEVQQKNPDNWPLITTAFTEAEEWFTGEAQQLIRAGGEGSQRAKELFQLIQEQTNRAADYWATSDKFGFKVAPAMNLLDAKEFAKDNSHWFPTSSATYQLEGGKLIAKGVPNKEGRAGILMWGPNGTKVTTMANGKDILPGTRETMRNYELTMKFKVVKKGFTLLARQTQGYQRHEYSFETKSAQEERKAASKRAIQDGKSGGGGGAFDDTPAGGAAATESNFFVEEGKMYEVIQQVYGAVIKIWVKEVGGADIDPLEDRVRARYGGLGIQLLPGAEIHFDAVQIKILL